MFAVPDLNLLDVSPLLGQLGRDDHQIVFTYRHDFNGIRKLVVGSVVVRI